ncbi:hypothetical protein EN943_15700 [Mesorhizobium sp. M7A.F.Ca.US.006.01.1.1]|uniref:hypothetical protein n=1 Tax=Mesorhizobium sp. M7A.F.Ca.US.006.01.1.1 TaxID=2496707 RepID=UPI000FCC0F49|nr:hypothetical protein [Mesorhizobium sp. M7A.F.Ca.US.006.01.1.1]RUZ76923.1 hypothetical protein EN943_15700 [Mesorhizobium sp. M7A.F.Ca.US.006.01.1.1]
MAYVPHTPNLGFPPIAATLPASNAAGRSTPGPWLGDIIRAQDPVYGVGEFIYLKGVASTLVGSWALINPDDWSTTLLASGASQIGAVCVAMSANVANQYGWYQITGKALGLALAAFADNGLVYATATPGQVDDAVIAGARVKNALGASTIVGAGLAEFEINRPFMDNAAAA